MTLPPNFRCSISGKPLYTIRLPGFGTAGKVVGDPADPIDRGYTYGSESAWTDEVGSPIASAAQFKWHGYAPLVSIRKGSDYPATRRKTTLVSHPRTRTSLQQRC